MLVWENIDPRRYFTNKATQSLFLPPLSMWRNIWMIVYIVNTLWVWPN
jgi:hypothetical protein